MSSANRLFYNNRRGRIEGREDEELDGLYESLRHFAKTIAIGLDMA